MINAKKIILGFGLFVILGIIFGSYYYLNQPPKGLLNILNNKWRYPIMGQIASNMKVYKNVGFQIIKQDPILWQKDEYMVFLPSVDSIMIEYQNPSEELKNGDANSIYNLTPFGEIIKEQNKFLIKQGFIVNEENSTKLGTGDYILSFQKNDLLCRISLSSDIFSYGPNGSSKNVEMRIKCTAGLDAAFSEQKPYLDVLNFKNKGIAIASVFVNGNFVRVNSTDDFDNEFSILKRDHDKLIIIDGPQMDEPLCETMDKWQVPKELYGSCYDKNNNLRN